MEQICVGKDRLEDPKHDGNWEDRPDIHDLNAHTLPLNGAAHLKNVRVNRALKRIWNH